MPMMHQLAMVQKEGASPSSSPRGVRVNNASPLSIPPPSPPPSPPARAPSTSRLSQPTASSQRRASEVADSGAGSSGAPRPAPQYTSDLRGLSEMTRHLRAELSSQDDSVRELRLSHESMSSTVDGVHRDMRAITARLEGWLDSGRTEAGQRDAAIRLEMRQLASDVETLKVTAEGVREAQSRLDAFHREAAADKQTIGVLRAEVAFLHDALKASDARSAESARTTATMREELTTMQQRVAALTSGNGTEVSRWTALGTELKSGLQEASATLTSVAARQEATESLVEEFSRQHERMRRGVKRHEAQLTEVTRGLQGFGGDASEALSSMGAEIATIRETLSAWESAIYTLGADFGGIAAPPAEAAAPAAAADADGGGADGGGGGRAPAYIPGASGATATPWCGGVCAGGSDRAPGSGVPLTPRLTPTRRRGGGGGFGRSKVEWRPPTFSSLDSLAAWAAQHDMLSSDEDDAHDSDAAATAAKASWDAEAPGGDPLAPTPPLHLRAPKPKFRIPSSEAGRAFRAAKAMAAASPAALGL